MWYLVSPTHFNMAHLAILFVDPSDTLRNAVAPMGAALGGEAVAADNVEAVVVLPRCVTSWPLGGRRCGQGQKGRQGGHNLQRRHF